MRKIWCAFLMFGLCAFIISCVPDVPPISCEDWDFDCYNRQALNGVVVVRNHIMFLSKLNLAVQVLVAIFSIVATVMIALQGDNNKHWTRPIGLISTALVTGLTSAMATFHVPENTDHLIDIVGEMVTITNKYGAETEGVKRGRSVEEFKREYQRDPRVREKVGEITTNFCNDYNEQKLCVLKLLGTVGRGASVNPPDVKKP